MRHRTKKGNIRLYWQYSGLDVEQEVSHGPLVPALTFFNGIGSMGPCFRGGSIGYEVCFLYEDSESSPY